ncbi:MAG: hypothetical protein ACM34M_07945 [Ignavibacteria bacterium]
MKQILFILFFSINLSGQISFTEFPKIGFNDMFLLANGPMYYGGKPHLPTYNAYLADSFYYPELRELGLNYIVTLGGGYDYPGDKGFEAFKILNIPLNPGYNPTLKVLDLYFALRLTRYDKDHPMFLGGVYAGAQGNAEPNEYYQTGGKKTGYDSKVEFGFGKEGETSVWVKIPPSVQPAGDYNFNDNGRRVFAAMTAEHSPGFLLEAQLPAYHQARKPFISADITDSIKYRLVLNARINRYTNSRDTTTVAWVSISETDANIRYTYSNTLSKAVSKSFIYPLRVKDFGGNKYVDLTSPYFYKESGLEKDIIIKVYWTGKKDLFIDHFYVYDNFYERMFISADSNFVFKSIKKQLQATFGSVVKNPLYAHFFYDEPWPNSYRSLSKIISLSKEQFSGNKYIAGAIGDYPEHMLRHGNSQGRLPYIMSDKYPFWWNVSGSSTSGKYTVQMGLDSLIYSPRKENSSHGLKVAIDMAQNFSRDTPGDDVPLVCAIQVQAEKLLQNGNIKDMRFRAPSPNEIKVQGFISICCGAKGLAYYTVNTQSPSFSDQPLNLATYGLFDEEGNPYKDSGSELSGLHQDPAKYQKPNERFNAVKELNASINKFGKELLQLTWRNGFSIHRAQPSDTYISGIKSYKNNTPDSDTTAFAELGIFRNSKEMDNENLEYFFIVNRRTENDGNRRILVKFNKKSGYKSWKVTEVGTDKYWITANTGSFQTDYAPAEGKLFKFTPVIN